VRHLLPDAGSGQQHLDGEGHDGEERADNSEPEQAEKNRSGCPFAECADEHREDGAAGRRTSHSAKDDGKIQRNRSTMKDLQLIG